MKPRTMSTSSSDDIVPPPSLRDDDIDDEIDNNEPLEDDHFDDGEEEESGVTTTTSSFGEDSSYPLDGSNGNDEADDPNSNEEYRARILSQRTIELMANFKEYTTHDFDNDNDDNKGLMSLAVDGIQSEDIENGMVSDINNNYNTINISFLPRSTDDVACFSYFLPNLKNDSSSAQQKQQQLFSIDDKEDENDDDNDKFMLSVDEFHSYNTHYSLDDRKTKKGKYAISFLKSQKRVMRGMGSIIFLTIIII